MALDAATSVFVQRMAESGAPPIWEMTPVQAREMGSALRGMYGDGPDMERVENLTLQSSAGGGFRVRVLVPGPSPSAVIVYFHGGGWVTGNIDEFDTLGRKLAASTNAAVVLVDYRKAPEHPYPVPLEDAWSAILWAAENLREIAGGIRPLVVAGDSAGGNLAAVCAIRAKKQGNPEIALQILVYPVTDADFENASYTDETNQLMLSKPGMMWFWDQYVADVGRRSDPEAAPLKTPSLEGLPPAIVVTAEHDPLRDEGEAYAARLVEAGVPVEHHRFNGQMHGFFTFVNVLPGSEEGLTYVTDKLNAILGKADAK